MNFLSGGCWFCPNAKKNELQRLRSKHKELWEKLIELENVPETICRIWNTLTRTSIHQKEEEFFEEDRELEIFDFEEGIGVNRLFVIFVVDDLMYGIPAEVVADDYAKYYAARDKSYIESFYTMLDYFDKRDSVFENWVREHLTFQDVMDTLMLLQCDREKVDWVDSENENTCETKVVKYGYFSLKNLQEYNSNMLYCLIHCSLFKNRENTKR